MFALRGVFPVSQKTPRTDPQGSLGESSRDDAIAYRPFDKDVFRFVRICEYDKADIKQFLEVWLATKTDNVYQSY